MKVALIDYDINKRRRAFPNLALMKLSAYHKAKGDEVSMLNFPICQPDITYASCVFTWNKPEEIDPNVIKGGSGFGITDELPHEIEHIMPDYSLYPSVNFSMGFTSRGCIRNCSFCKVRWKEGNIRAHANIYEFYNPDLKRMLLLDNNHLAAGNWKETLTSLAELQLETDFNQGNDIRLLDDEKAYYLSQLKVKHYRFAFDDISYEDSVRRGIDILLKAGISKRKIVFYVLVGYEPNDKAIERMKILQSYGVDVYPMIYKADNGQEPNVNYNFNETLHFHGARGNLRRFLRLAGRLS